MSCHGKHGELGAGQQKSGGAYLYPLDRHGLEHGLVLVQGSQAVWRYLWGLLGSLEVELDVEVRIAVLLVQAAALPDDLVDLLLAGLCGLLVRG